MAWKEPVYVAKVKSVKGTCSAGHKVGDTFEINTHKTGGICGYCYHDFFPYLMTVAMGGKVPWFKSQDDFDYECPDKYNLVAFNIKKQK